MSKASPFVALALLLLGAATASWAQVDPTFGGPATSDLPNIPSPDGQTSLPNGWKLSPVGTATQLAGDMPTRMLLTADGKYLLTATGGYTVHGISVVDVATGKLIDSVKVPATFAGMCMDPANAHVLLSAGGSKVGDALYSFAFKDGQLTPEAGVDIQAIPRTGRFIGGLECDAAGAIYVASVRENKIYKAASGQKTLSQEVGYRPCAIVLSPDGQTLAVANWGGKSIDLLDTKTLSLNARVEVGDHPAAIAWDGNARCFVANANSNTVSVVDVETKSVTETIRTSLDFQLPVGSTPLALAVDSVGKRLYIANADNNDVAVVDIADVKESKVIGFIPTGWYPCAMTVSKDGKTVFIGTGKALNKFGPNKPATAPATNPANAVPAVATPPAEPATLPTSRPATRPTRHIASLFTGHVSAVPSPDAKALVTYTRQVLANTPMPRTAEQLTKEQAEVMKSALGNIKHVIYVIKENRTYDQVFGELPQGNGDPSLCMFGRKVTPNHHKLAEQWVLLDNLYCNGEVSVDGHAWCDAAYANDFNQRSWTNTYSKRPGLDADDRLQRQPGGYIWDNAIAHKVSFFSYGEGSKFIANPEVSPVVDANQMKGMAFSKPWQDAAWGVKKGKRDHQRIDIFIDDLRKAEQTGNWPGLIVMALPEDHTHGRTVGTNTPDACVASNDLALGKLVDAVSHSKFWAETAIFVIEDDAQNGVDHVDAHRTIGFVISPYVRRAAVDHTMYTTASMIRTIELILGLPPMTQYDAAATPMFASFTTKPDLTPFTHLEPQTDLSAVNPPNNPGAKASAKLDFSDVDLADEDELNEILWAWFKPNTKGPPPVRSLVFVK